MARRSGRGRCPSPRAGPPVYGDGRMRGVRPAGRPREACTEGSAIRTRAAIQGCLEEKRVNEVRQIGRGITSVGRGRQMAGPAAPRRRPHANASPECDGDMAGVSARKRGGRGTGFRGRTCPAATSDERSGRKRNPLSWRWRGRRSPRRAGRPAHRFDNPLTAPPVERSRRAAELAWRHSVARCELLPRAAASSRRSRRPRTRRARPVHAEESLFEFVPRARMPARPILPRRRDPCPPPSP